MYKEVYVGIAHDDKFDFDVEGNVDCYMPTIKKMAHRENSPDPDAPFFPAVKQLYNIPQNRILLNESGLAIYFRQEPSLDTSQTAIGFGDYNGQK